MRMFPFNLSSPVPFLLVVVIKSIFMREHMEPMV